MHLKLYTDSFAKVQLRANSEGAALAQVVSAIVDEYFEKQVFQFDEVRYREEVLARLTGMLKEHHDGIAEQLTLLQQQITEAVLDGAPGAAETIRLSAEVVALRETFLTQKGGVNLILNLCIEIALRVMTAEHFLLHYLADPYLTEHAETLGTPQLFNSVEHPEKYLNAATVALQSRLHRTHRRNIRNSLEDARKQMGADKTHPTETGAKSG